MLAYWKYYSRTDWLQLSNTTSVKTLVTQRVEKCLETERYEDRSVDKKFQTKFSKIFRTCVAVYLYENMHIYPSLTNKYILN
jgi:hypothetical protein